MENVNRVDERIVHYLSHPRENKKEASFYEGLAALASADRHSFLRRILPPTELEQFRTETHCKLPIKLQLKLNAKVVHCLKMANGILENERDSSLVARMSRNWYTMVGIFAEPAWLQDDLRASHYALCQEYEHFIAANGKYLTTSDVILFLLNKHSELRRFSNTSNYQSGRSFSGARIQHCS